jgi:hypothetical protein
MSTLPSLGPAEVCRVWHQLSDVVRLCMNEQLHELIGRGPDLSVDDCQLVLTY